MKRLAFSTTLVLALASVFLICKNGANTETESNTISGTENASHVREGDKPKSPSLAEIEVAKAIAKGLMHNFEYTKDTFTGVEVFEHKNNKTIRNKSLDLQVNTETSVAFFAPVIIDNILMCRCISLSEPNRKLHFVKILIKIDEEIETELIEIDRKTGTNGIEVYESFNDRIIRFITVNPNKKVLVRFEGKNRHRDFTLDKSQHEAICQTVELYDALMTLKRAGVDTSTIVSAKLAKAP